MCRRRRTTRLPTHRHRQAGRQHCTASCSYRACVSRAEPSRARPCLKLTGHRGHKTFYVLHQIGICRGRDLITVFVCFFSGFLFFLFLGVGRWGKRLLKLPNWSGMTGFWLINLSSLVGTWWISRSFADSVIVPANGICYAFILF